MPTKRSYTKLNIPLKTDAENLRHDYYVNIIPASVMNFDILVSADTEELGSATWKVFGIAKRSSTPETVDIVAINDPVVTATEIFRWTYVEVQADRVQGAVKISVVGVPETIITWHLSVQLKEV